MPTIRKGRTDQTGFSSVLGAIVAIELILSPWTSHPFDVGAFLSQTDRVFFLGMNPTTGWPFGGVFLLILLVSQLPILVLPAWSTPIVLRIALLKVPLILADLGATISLARTARQRGKTPFQSLRYLLDPVVFFTTVFHGTFDSLANAASALGIGYILEGNYAGAGLVLGFGAGAKYYPAALVPLLIVVSYRKRGWRSAITALSTFTLGAIGTLAPVLISGGGSITTGAVQNILGQSASRVQASPWSIWRGFEYLGVHLSGRNELYVAIIVPLFLALTLLCTRRVTERHVAQYALLTVVAIVVFDPGAVFQFYSWIVAPLAIYVIVTQDLFASYVGLAASILAVWMELAVEGSPAYWLNTFAIPPNMGTIHTILLPVWLYPLLMCAMTILCVRVLRRGLTDSRITAPRVWLQIIPAAAATTFLAAVIALGVLTAGQPIRRDYLERERLNTVNLVPVLGHRVGRACTLTYDLGEFKWMASRSVARHLTATLLFGEGQRLQIVDPAQGLTFRGTPVTVRYVITTNLVSRRVVLEAPVAVPRPLLLKREFKVTPCPGAPDIAPLLSYSIGIREAETAGKHGWDPKRGR
ncbi:MAG: DUF2029 domain-containing protein [Rhodanobacter sp.]|nr:MAG: DUF2029 domain-containing protein [Rhodanobacter sp.]